MKLIYFFFLFFLMLSLANAQIIIIPETISFQAFPGEKIAKTLTIKTEGTQAVWLNTSSNQIKVEPDSPFVVDNERNITINLTISKDIPPGTIRIYLSAGTSYITKTEYSGCGGSPSCSSSIKTIYKQNTTIIKEPEIIYINNQTTESNNKITGGVIGTSNRVYVAIIFLLVVVLLYAFYFILRRKNETKKDLD